MRPNPVLIVASLLVLLFVPFAQLHAQDSLMNMLDDIGGAKVEPKIMYTYATFKTTKIINGETVELPGPGVLKFDIAHRFNPVNQGWRSLFGLDGANIRFGLDYGITPYLAVGFGRSQLHGTYDAYIKAKLLRQSTGKRKYPLTIDAYANMACTSEAYPTEPAGRKNYFTSRLSYAFALLIARKFKHGFSIQLNPTLVHTNLVPSDAYHNDVFSIGAGARQMIGRSVSINGEVYFLPPGQVPMYSATTKTGAFHAMSIGVDIETGGHVFQIMLTNGNGMIDQQFVTQTTQRWRDGKINLGFNIDRVFTIYDYNKSMEKKMARAERKKKKK